MTKRSGWLRHCSYYFELLWGNCSAYLKERLRRFQNCAARIIANANYKINSADVLDSLG